MKPKRDNWKLDETSSHFIRVTLTENQDKILAFRHRWHIDGDGLADGNYFFPWRTEIEEECQNLRREIRVSELEAYFDAPDAILPRPVLSTELEDGLREEKRGNILEAVFKAEIRALGSQLQLPAEWDLIIDHYVTYNVFNFNIVFNHGITTSIRYKVSEEFGLIGENICLILGQNTGSEDLDNLWVAGIKPLLKNLIERVKDKKRTGVNAFLVEEMVKRGMPSGQPGRRFVDKETGSETGNKDMDIVLDAVGDKEADRLCRTTTDEDIKKTTRALGKKIQDIRYRHSKLHPRQ